MGGPDPRDGRRRGLRGDDGAKLLSYRWTAAVDGHGPEDDCSDVFARWTSQGQLVAKAVTLHKAKTAITLVVSIDNGDLKISQLVRPLGDVGRRGLTR